MAQQKCTIGPNVGSAAIEVKAQNVRSAVSPLGRLRGDPSLRPAAYGDPVAEEAMAPRLGGGKPIPPGVSGASWGHRGTGGLK